MTKKESTINITLPEIDIEVPRDAWDFYMSILGGIGVRNSTPAIQGDLSWLYSNFLNELRENGDLLASHVKATIKDFEKDPKPYVTGLDDDKPKKKKKSR